MGWTTQSERQEKEVEEVSDKEGSYVLPGLKAQRQGTRYFSCCCEQILDKKQLKEGCFRLTLDGIVRHQREGKTAAVWRIWSHGVYNQKIEVKEGFQLTFSSLFNWGPQSMG